MIHFISLQVRTIIASVASDDVVFKLKELSFALPGGSSVFKTLSLYDHTEGGPNGRQVISKMNIVVHENTSPDRSACAT